MSLLLLQRRGTMFSRACAGGRQNGVIWWCAFQTKVCYWIACGGKESVTNIHKGLKNIHSVNAVNKRTGNRCSSWIAGSEKGQAQLTNARRSAQPTTAVTQLLLQRADELTPNDRLMTTRKLVTKLAVSKREINNIFDALGYSEVCGCWVPWGLAN